MGQQVINISKIKKLKKNWIKKKLCKKLILIDPKANDLIMTRRKKLINKKVNKTVEQVDVAKSSD